MFFASFSLKWRMEEDEENGKGPKTSKTPKIMGKATAKTVPHRGEGRKGPETEDIFQWSL